jgi:hypothetical protein
MSPIEHRFHRSEAFAEDVVELVSMPPQPMTERRWLALANWLPLGVMLLGVAFAIA